MGFLLSVLIILHFVIAGVVIERRPDFMNTKTVAKVFAYFFAFHLAAGYVVKAAPWLVDPR